MNHYNKMELIKQKKSPTSLDKYVGIEIEFLSTAKYDTVADKLAAQDLHDYCNLGFDGSVSARDASGFYIDEVRGYELRILIPQQLLTEILPKITKVLSQCNAFVNATCGLHVHLDMRTRKYRSSLFKLKKNLGLISSIVDPSRLENKYCKLKGGKGRYKAINYTEAFRKYNTIEVRVHQGTVKDEEIINWAGLLVAIVDGKTIPTSVMNYVNKQRSKYDTRTKRASAS